MIRSVATGLAGRISSSRLRTALRVVRSFMPWAGSTKIPPAGALPIKLHRQWTAYSCTAAVAQMVADYYGVRISHWKAIELTGCKPIGATLAAVAKALQDYCGFTAEELRTRSSVREALARGELVISNDLYSYAHSHAILLIGATPRGFWIADPAVCEIYWRDEEQVFAGAEEFIAISGGRVGKYQAASR